MAEEVTLAELLSRCAVDVRSRLSRDEIRPAYGREAELAAIMQLLISTEHLHPIILGKARSGKTALAYEVARRIVAGDVPETLRDLPIYEISPASLLAGLQFGEGWRSNVSTLLAQLSEAGPALVFMRDVHAAIGGGIKRGDDEDDDLAAALEAGLRDSQIKIIAEARPDRWDRIGGDRETFADLFAPIPLPVLSDEAVAAILQRVAERAVERTAIEIGPETQAMVLDVSKRFILNQAFPGKAIELLEDALLRAERQKEPALESRHIIDYFAERTGLARLMIDEHERFDEAALRRSFSERVLGQEPAVIAMVQKLALLKARLHDPARPMGVYLFLGPTGVGKTELAKTLAATLFGSEERFVRFNMADFSGEYDYLHFFGKTWGDNDAERRGKLTTALSNLPFAVVLLDEFEKAHRSIFQRFLQLFDEGLLVNAMGEEVNLRNTIIIMTSNFGASIVQGETWGFSAREGMEAVERRVLRETEEFFSPEFINRLDGVTFFKPLSQSDMRQIAARELRKLFDREGLVRRGVEVELDDAVLEVLLRQGYSMRYGARYLKRQIEKMVTYPLASALLTEPHQQNGLLRLYVARDHIKAAWVSDDEEPLPPSPEGVAGPQTLEDAQTLALSLAGRLDNLTQALGLLQARERQSVLMEEMSGPAFWDDPARAQVQMAELGEVARRVDRCNDLLRLLDEFQHLLERVRDGRERRLFPEMVNVGARLERDLRFAELELYFRVPEEWGEALIVFECAAEGQGLRWLHQLVGAYSAWASAKVFEVTIIDEAPPEAGQVRVTLRVSGAGAYGLLLPESGTHRIAETGGEPRRKTVTQVIMTVLPLPGDQSGAVPEVELDLSSAEVRSSGQYLRKIRGTARAVHVPSGLAALAAAATERAASDVARTVLQARLLHRQINNGRLATAADPWGSVVRSYHFAKRSYVKVPRTGVTTANPRDVFAGNLDPFIEAALRTRLATSIY